MTTPHHTMCASQRCPPALLSTMPKEIEPCGLCLVSIPSFRPPGEFAVSSPTPADFHGPCERCDPGFSGIHGVCRFCQHLRLPHLFYCLQVDKIWSQFNYMIGAWTETESAYLECRLCSLQYTTERRRGRASAPETEPLGVWLYQDTTYDRVMVLKNGAHMGCTIWTLRIH